MGINLVVIVENSKGVSLQEFRDALLKTRYGTYVWEKRWEEKSFTPWKDFEFEGKRYFSWIFTPRSHYFNLWGEDGKDTKEHKTYRALLFKALLAVEKIAGGPIYIGQDVVYTALPNDEPGQFRIPLDLDILWRNWREIAKKSKLPKYHPRRFVY